MKRVHSTHTHVCVCVCVVAEEQQQHIERNMMMRACEDSHVLLSLIEKLVIVWLQLCMMAKLVSSNNKNVSASDAGFYVFGDSTVDPGNNNYISNTPLKSNFPPYGRDLPDHVPSGRFTNAKLATDYIASYAGLKKEFVPPYLDPKLDMEELLSGVSFASAGSGFDPQTSALSNVISMPKQLQYFREYKKRLEGVVGRERRENHIHKSAFLISAATNDFIFYFSDPIRRKSFTAFTYQQFLIQQLKTFVQELWEEGAREIAVVGLPPVGCLPIMITLNSFDMQRGCLDEYSSVARDYNHMLQQELQLMQQRFSNSSANFYYVDIYGPLADMIQAPHKYGFDEVNDGCCGSGYIETAFMCNERSPVCSDASKYVFWDSLHPTDKAYHYIFLAAQSTVDFIIQRMLQRH